MNFRRTLLEIAAVMCITGFQLDAQVTSSIRKDHVFTDAGRGLVTVATGIPYISIGEIAYGIDDRTTVGLIYGLTPNVEGYGIRARRVVSKAREDFRIYFCVPVLYYPKTKDLGGEPWFLTRPNINFEWITGSFLRYKIGGSLIAAASQPSLFGGERNGEGFKGGVWNAMHGGVSFPMGRIMFQIELSVVMDGFRLAGDNWVGGPPVILVMGIAMPF